MRIKYYYYYLKRKVRWEAETKQKVEITVWVKRKLTKFKALFKKRDNHVFFLFQRTNLKYNVT